MKRPPETFFARFDRLMTWALASLFDAWTERRWRAPEITALCMDFSARRQVRLELRIVRSASEPDWSVRRVEWLEPAGVTIARAGGGEAAKTSLDVDLKPRSDGGWFEGGGALWARYPGDKTTAHRVRLRLTLEHAGRSHVVGIDTVFPAMDWTPLRAPAARPSSAIAAQPWRLEPREVVLVGEPRSWMGS